ncbi:MAG: hypothetical protein R2752_22060 [Vicinamibacterales bacterium]
MMRIGRVPVSWPAALLAGAATGLAVLVAAGLGAMLVWPVSTTFNVTVQTERVEFRRPVASPARWVIDDVTLVDGDDEHPGLSGSVEFGAPIRGFIERVAFGDVWGHFECEAPCTSVGRLYDDLDQFVRPLQSVVEIFIADLPARANAGRTVLIPLAGEVVSGRSVGIEVSGTTAVLREGTVSLLDRTAFGNNIFEARRVELSAGDQFQVAEPDPDAPTLGFILADERPALTAAYRVVGRRGTVVRPGGGSYTISASALGRLFGDDLFRAISAVLAVLGTFATIAAVIVALAQMAQAPAPPPAPPVTSPAPDAPRAPDVPAAPGPSAAAPAIAASSPTRPARTGGESAAAATGEAANEAGDSQGTSPAASGADDKGDHS